MSTSGILYVCTLTLSEVEAIASVTPVTLLLLKPADRTSISYEPGSRLLMEESPFFSDITVFDTPVAVLVAVTIAAGMPASCESATTP